MLIFTVFLLFMIQGSNGSFEFERYIHDKILNNYNKDVRPQKASKEPVVVHFEMKMQKLVSLDVRKQILTLNAFTLLRWNDEQLKWNKSEVNGTDRVNMGSTLIWTPDIVLYNTADESSYAHTDLYKTKALVFSSGKVVWSSPVTWRISCNMDITWFPVDRQTCNFTFGSNSYSRSQIKLLFLKKPTQKSELFSGNFKVDSGEWSIDNLDSYEESITFSCCPEPFSSIRYELNLSRMSLYYFLYIILPLMSLMFLFLLVFHIPHDSGERMGFGVTILLSITVYLLVISEKLPEKSDNYPMLGMCFIVIFYILCGALAMAAATTIFASRREKPPAFVMDWLKRNQKKKKSKTKIGPKDSIMLTSPVEKINASDENANEIDDDDEDDDADYSADWLKICRLLDKRLFIFFNVLMIFVPVVIIIALPKSGLALIESTEDSTESTIL